MHAFCCKQTVIGEITIAESHGKITHLKFGNHVFEKNFIPKETELIEKAFELLKKYFDGKIFSFSQLPLNPNGTDFQKKVWNALIKIPYGKTASYKNIAQMIDNPKAYRAVGNANNKNPIPIFIPCHRIIGYNNKLVGYGGGLEIKKTLLELENKFYQDKFHQDKLYQK